MSCKCGDEPKYKCPACRAPYCSVACFKEHKLECAGSVAAVEPEAEAPAPAPAPAAMDAEVARMLKFASLRQHLKLVATIMSDPAVSREQTAEGRQLVALKKLRELRKGGREENELVEEFCEYVARM